MLARSTFDYMGMTKLYSLMLDHCEDEIKQTLEIFTHRKCAFNSLFVSFSAPWMYARLVSVLGA